MNIIYEKLKKIYDEYKKINLSIVAESTNMQQQIQIQQEQQITIQPDYFINVQTNNIYCNDANKFNNNRIGIANNIFDKVDRKYIYNNNIILIYQYYNKYNTNVYSVIMNSECFAYLYNNAHLKNNSDWSFINTQGHILSSADSKPTLILYNNTAKKKYLDIKELFNLEFTENDLDPSFFPIQKKSYKSHGMKYKLIKF
jgi:hypothetical protein